ncbi:hypothetical protein [Nocardioides bizhenqiangii]|uniref:DUF222 domain-containing protein n=1 Tax=Nocardioides bizhenqiangii TaxID=3095076 RepID=A0ABZ0ZTB0_9ACTN|nr:hypothetical protein [Nocardioides sp. HM61]WQQ26738.1 hypothetical protein SHK19_00560 [Nocardioides sp. HM61]
MELGDLDAKATLAVAEGEVPERRRQGVERLLLLQHWADLHAEDPQARPGAVPVSRGGDRLVRLGGEGTPLAAELCWAELAIAFETGAIALRNQAGQALDLRHRLPLLWALVQELRVEPWVGQKVAAMTRELTREQAAIVDAAVADAAAESPGRLLAIAEAKTIEADIEGYRTRLAEEAKRTGVWVSRPKAGDLVDAEEGEPGTGRMSAKLPLTEVVEGAAMVDDVAEVLAVHGDHDPHDPPTRDQLRAQAFALLVTDPHAAAALLDQADAPPSPETEDREPAPVPKRKRRPATLLVHLTDQVLRVQVGGVARVEGLGPVLLEQVADLLKHRQVTVQPVIDLNSGHSVNGYEHPTAVKLRTRLRTVYDVFPHSTSRATARLDHDHPTPYDPDGPPGQTGDHNDAPLTRFHHRAKTHDRYTVDQLGLGAYRWVTRHGLARVVTPRGTKKVQLIRARDGTITGEIYRDARIDIDYPRRT